MIVFLAYLVRDTVFFNSINNSYSYLYYNGMISKLSNPSLSDFLGSQLSV